MNFYFDLLEIEDVNEIAKWPMTDGGDNIDMGPYFMSNERGEKPLKGPAKCQGYLVHNGQGERIGLFEYYKKGKNFEIGLALAPEMRRKKLGRDFVAQGIDFGLTLFPDAKKIHLEVEDDNLAAIKVYQALGFQEVSRKYKSIAMVLFIKKD